MIDKGSISVSISCIVKKLSTVEQRYLFNTEQNRLLERIVEFGKLLKYPKEADAISSCLSIKDKLQSMYGAIKILSTVDLLNSPNNPLSINYLKYINISLGFTYLLNNLKLIWINIISCMKLTRTTKNREMSLKSSKSPIKSTPLMGTPSEQNEVDVGVGVDIDVYPMLNGDVISDPFHADIQFIKPNIYEKGEYCDRNGRDFLQNNNNHSENDHKREDNGAVERLEKHEEAVDVQFEPISQLKSKAADVKRVRFDPKPTVHVMRMWDYAYRAARKGDWEDYARDRVRFQLRIQRTAKCLDPILECKHRKAIYSSRFSS